MFTIVHYLTVMTIKLIMFHPEDKICRNENKKQVSCNRLRALNIITK